MYVYVYCTCVCIHAGVCVYVSMWVDTNIHRYMCVSTPLKPIANSMDEMRCGSLCIHACMYIHIVYMYVHMYVGVYVCLCAVTNILQYVCESTLSKPIVTSINKVT